VTSQILKAVVQLPLETQNGQKSPISDLIRSGERSAFEQESLKKYESPIPSYQ